MWEHGYPSTRRKNKNLPPPPPSNATCGDPEEHAPAPAPAPASPALTRPQPPRDSHSATPPQTQQVCNQGGHSHIPPHSDDPSNCGMPEKHMLQLVIDILQRRDTYEIFAEPVDPNEVEDYYQIIKEPMDFGTMRAKLHEGIYKNLEQFKHDVFLITRNAMHFNSSATIYFRQARAIHELAKTVFHVLGTDPENFEVEFSGTRRRSTRRAHNEANGFRLATHVKASGVAINVSSKGTPSSAEKSLAGKVNRRNPLLASMAIHTNRNNCGFFSGATVGRRSNYVGTEHRCTYRPQSYPFGCDKNLFGSNCFRSEPLVLTNHPGTNYRESLLLFVKDLGPTAHMIATQKIRGLQESTRTCQSAGTTGWRIQAPDQCQTSTACGTCLRGLHHWDSICITAPHKISGLLPGCCCSVLKTTADIRIDYGSAEGGQEECGKKRKSSKGCASRSLGEENAVYTEGINVVSASGGGKVVQDRKSTEFWLGSCSSGVSVGAGVSVNSWMVSNRNNSAKSSMASNADAEGGGKMDENVLRPVILALEHSHGNVSSELKSRNKKSCTASTDHWGSESQSKVSSNHVNHTLGRCHEATGSLVTPTQVLQPLDLNNNKKKNDIMQGTPAALSDFPFTFNMHFLKAQLDQMNNDAAAAASGSSTQDDAELQLITSRLETRSRSWDRDDAETQERGSASFVDVQGQKRRRLCNSTSSTSMELLVLNSSISRPLSSSSVE